MTKSKAPWYQHFSAYDKLRWCCWQCRVCIPHTPPAPLGNKNTHTTTYYNLIPLLAFGYSSFKRACPQLSTHPLFPFPLSPWSEGKLSSLKGPRLSRYAAKMVTARTDISSPKPSQTYTKAAWFTCNVYTCFMWCVLHVCACVAHIVSHICDEDILNLPGLKQQKWL